MDNALGYVYASMTFKDLKSQIDHTFRSCGFVKDGAKWSLAGPDSVVKCDLQKSSFGGQCWLNVDVICSFSDQGPTGRAYFRLETLFPDDRLLIQDLLNLDDTTNSKASIERALCDLFIPVLRKLTQMASLKSYYTRYLQNGALIDQNFRAIMALH